MARGAWDGGGTGPQAAPSGGTQAQGHGGADRGRTGPPWPAPAAAGTLTCSGSASPSAGGTRSAPPRPLSKQTAFSVKTMQRACAAQACPRPAASPPRREPTFPAPRATPTRPSRPPGGAPASAAGEKRAGQRSAAS